MMDALTAIRERRSIKRYKEEPLSRETLEKLLAAGYDAPTGANRHPREFIVVTGRAALQTLGEVHPYCAWLKGASAAIVIAADAAKGRYWLEDSCASAENMWIAATALGLGMAWSAIYQAGDAQETARREAVVRSLLEIPENLNVPIVLAVGIPDGEPAERKRPAIESIVHWGKYRPSSQA
jgi:nitroreductase